MKSKLLRTLFATCLLGAAVVLVALAAGPRAVTGAPNDDGPVQRYIVVLNEPPLALYQGGIRGLAPTAVEAVRRADPEDQEGVHLNVNSPAAQAYTAYLLRRQAAMIDRVQALAPEFNETDWQYQYVLNGFVAQLTSRHAEAVRRLAGVRLVHPVEELVPEMDSSNPLVGSPVAWEAAGGLAEAGAGARLGTLEAGNAVAHPFFSDTGMPPAPEGWPQAVALQRDGTATDLTNTSVLVNNKVLGFKVVADELTEANINTLNNGLNVSGHGSHVLGTVGGRHGTYEIQPDISVEMAGVAPMAQLFTYPVFGGTAEMIKAFEIMVEDEIDAVNLSLGTTTWLLDTVESHPVSLAMSGAAEAGLVVVGSSGNAGGNGRTSMSAAWKYHEDVIAVGNTTSTGVLGYELTIDDPDAPAAVQRMIGGLRGAAYTMTITADLVYRDDGGCNPSPEVADKIAVVERFDENGGSVGACGYEQRATIMRDSGAVAIIYVYYDRLNGDASTTALALPSLALGARDGEELVGWMKAGNTAVATMGIDLLREYTGVPDYLAGSSSRGPGLDWSIKPDISAPGTSIISAVLTGQAGQRPTVPTWPAFSGTSMSAPHITGAAGMLRSIHPEWTARQVKAALLTTAEPSVVTGSALDPRPADPTEGGVGRLDLSDAWDPRALLNPPKLSFGKLAPDEAKTIEVQVESATSKAIKWEIALEPSVGDADISLSAESVTVKPGETGSFSVTFTPDLESEIDEHWGYVVLRETEVPAGPPTIYLPALVKDAELGEVTPEPASRGLGTLPRQAEDEEEAPRTLRLAYFAYVDSASGHKDVMLINWTYGNTEDYGNYYTEALDALGLSYTVWGLGEPGEHPAEVARSAHPPYKEMMKHDLVILNANMSPIGLQQRLAGQFQYQNLVLGGGNLLIAGQGTQGWWRFLSFGSRLADNANNRAAYPETFPYFWSGPSQNVGCEMCLARYFAGYTPGYTATLSGRHLVPFPATADMPELEVILAPHAEAEAPFSYSLDISTGDLAKDGAAGNQYRFNSGGVARDYIPTAGNDPATPPLENQMVAGLGDIGDAQGVMERYSQLARPLWSYEVDDATMVVGTYIAGKHHPEAKVPWNAMYWGFGLEGVGEGDEGTVDRERLLGDTFNFLARNMSPAALVQSQADGSLRLVVDLGRTAADVRFSRAEIDWGDGRRQAQDFPRPVLAADLEIRPTPITSSERVGPVRIKLIPLAGTAAPVYLRAHLP